MSSYPQGGVHLDPIGGVTHQASPVEDYVYAEAGSYTKGQLLRVKAGATVPSAATYGYCVCATVDTGLAGPIVAETVTVPTGGGKIKVWVGGVLTGATHGVTADGGGILAGALVSSSATSGAIGTATGTYGAAVGQSVIGICLVAFTASTADGTLLLFRSRH